MGMIILGVWLILSALMTLIGLSWPGAVQIMAVVALVAGILILAGR
jgi:hypothetical protein